MFFKFLYTPADLVARDCWDSLLQTPGHWPWLNSWPPQLVSKVNTSPTTKAWFYAPAVEQEADVLKNKQPNNKKATTSTNWKVTGCGWPGLLGAATSLPKCPEGTLKERDTPKTQDCQSQLELTCLRWSACKWLSEPRLVMSEEVTVRQ